MNSGKLYAAHRAIWNAVGVTSFFGGAVVDGASIAKKQALALASGAAAVHVPCNNVVNPPAAAIFVDKAAAKSGVQSISSADAAALLAKADASADAAKFEELLTQAATKSFVVASDADVAAALAKL